MSSQSKNIREGTMNRKRKQAREEPEASNKDMVDEEEIPNHLKVKFYALDELQTEAAVRRTIAALNLAKHQIWKNKEQLEEEKDPGKLAKLKEEQKELRKSEKNWIEALEQDTRWDTSLKTKPCHRENQKKISQVKKTVLYEIETPAELRKVNQHVIDQLRQLRERIQENEILATRVKAEGEKWDMFYNEYEIKLLNKRIEEKNKEREIHRERREEEKKKLQQLTYLHEKWKLDSQAHRPSTSTAVERVQERGNHEHNQQHEDEDDDGEDDADVSPSEDRRNDREQHEDEGDDGEDDADVSPTVDRRNGRGTPLPETPERKRRRYND